MSISHDTHTPDIFDTALLRRRRERVAIRNHQDDFLFHEVAERMIDRLLDVKRRFGRSLEIGGRAGFLTKKLLEVQKAERGFILEQAPSFAKKAHLSEIPSIVTGLDVIPVQEASFDLLVSNLALHWVNDLPGALVQANRSLKPDGLFQAAILGGETLHELRTCLIEAEMRESNGVSARISPMVDLRDAAGLLQRAGFALPVADLDRITVTYRDAFHLMVDLRSMGENNAVLNRVRRPTKRGVFLRAAELYKERYENEEGRICATFDVIHLHGWRPAESQPKPKSPGSATSSLARALGTVAHKV